LEREGHHRLGKPDDGFVMPRLRLRTALSRWIAATENGIQELSRNGGIKIFVGIGSKGKVRNDWRDTPNLQFLEKAKGASSYLRRCGESHSG